MLIIRDISLFKFEWRQHLQGLLVIVAAEKIFHSNTLEPIENISFYLEHFWTMRSSESLKSGLILSIYHSLWKNFKVTGWSSSPICHKQHADFLCSYQKGGNLKVKMIWVLIPILKVALREPRYPEPFCYVSIFIFSAWIYKHGRPAVLLQDWELGGIYFSIIISKCLLKIF